MDSNEAIANAEAAFTVEFASSLALSSLTEVARKDVVRMAWLLGYCKGRSDGLGQALSIRVELIPGRPEHDMNTRGSPLKPGR